MTLGIVQVDAFTSVPFAGNPAAVCVLDAPAEERWMQLVAREMNLSETAFLVRREDGFGLRWFTPAVEVALCGHATLASAHVLWQDGYLGHSEQALFHTASGLLTADRAGEWIVMDFPSKPEEPASEPAGLRQALGATPQYVGRNEFDLVVELASTGAVERLKPDFARMAALPFRGIVVTSRSASPEYDFVSRFFAPACGVPEDPVTGSSHCCLAPFWAQRLGKTEMTGYQASARGGIVRVRLVGDRVKLEGQAITVMRGELL